MKKIVCVIIFALLQSSCDNYLDIEPKGRVIPSKVEDFRWLLNSGYQVFPSYKARTAFRSDELSPDLSSNDFPAYENIYIWEDVNTTEQNLVYHYIDFYQSIFYANETISGLSGFSASSERDQILAEAYALRAYAYFGLINMYALPYDKEHSATDKGVPLVLKTDLEQEFPKASVEEVYHQILSDISSSERLMKVSVQEAGLRYRFSKSALYALASRVYLYRNEFEKSIAMADKALSFGGSLVDLTANASLEPSAYDSSESILALEEVFPSRLNSASLVSSEMIGLFDTSTDLRFPLYFSENSGQYKVLKSGDPKYKCSFRVAELYLNKIESWVRLGEEQQAKTALWDFLKKRYTAEGFQMQRQRIEALTSDALLEAVWQERARELAFEGHRWFDLRRTSRKSITHNLKGKDYVLQHNDPRYVIPFPKEAIKSNDFLSQ